MSGSEPTYMIENTNLNSYSQTVAISVPSFDKLLNLGVATWNKRLSHVRYYPLEYSLTFVFVQVLIILVILMRFTPYLGCFKDVSVISFSCELPNKALIW
jgi:hypothetical protein